MTECSDDDKKAFYQLITTVHNIVEKLESHEERHCSMENRVGCNEREYIPAAKQAVEAHAMVHQMKVSEGEVRAELEAHGNMLEMLLSRNLTKDQSDEEFKEKLFTRLHKIEVFVAVNKFIGGAFVLIGLPLITWLIRNDISEKKIPPATNNDKTVKVKKFKKDS